MKYVIHEIGDDVHDELSMYGIDFDDSDVSTIFTSQDDGSIKEFQDIGLMIFDIYKHVVAVFPVDDEIYQDIADPDAIRESYRIMINEVNIFPTVVRAFQEFAGKVMDPDVWIVSIEAIPLEDKEQEFPTKTGGREQLRVRSYLIKKDMRGQTVDTLRFDTYAVHTLCNNVIDMTYLMDSLKSTEKKNVLLTVFEKANKVVAIRTTKMISQPRFVSEVMGAYACSKGYGKLIQEWTENLIRMQYPILFTSSNINMPMTFRLSAVDTAVSFWEHVGFVRTGKLDKEGQAILEKPLFSPRHTIKRAHSNSLSSQRKRKVQLIAV